MLKGFKEFLMRGNVVDLAVAVVIGAAFVAIVKAFTDGIVNPLLAVFGNAASPEGLGFRLVSDKPATFIEVGNIITTTINFLIVAAILYFGVVLPYNTYKKRRAAAGDEMAKTDNELLAEIRDLLADQRDGSPRG